MKLLIDLPSRTPVAIVDVGMSLGLAVAKYLRHTGAWSRKYYADLTGEQYVARGLYHNDDGFLLEAKPFLTGGDL